MMMDASKGIEFYNSPDCSSIMVHEAGTPDKELSQADINLVNDILDNIQEIYSPKTFTCLRNEYARYKNNTIYYRFRMANRFCRCNFGSFDLLQQDIDKYGFWHIEEVSCPLRGECNCEGIICKPQPNNRLTEREEEVIRYIAQGLNTQEIADILFLSIATINRHRENAKTKLGLHSVAQLASYYFRYLQH